MLLEDKFWTEQITYLWVLQSVFPLAYLSLWLLYILNTDTSILLAGFLRGEYVNLPIFWYLCISKKEFSGQALARISVLCSKL